MFHEALSLIWLDLRVIYSKKGQFFRSIRNYDSSQTNPRKNLSSPSNRKSNLKIIKILVREILNGGSGRKTMSKRHRPKTGRAARWELNWPWESYLLSNKAILRDNYQKIRYLWIQIHIYDNFFKIRCKKCFSL